MEALPTLLKDLLSSLLLLYKYFMGPVGKMWSRRVIPDTKVAAAL